MAWEGQAAVGDTDVMVTPGRPPGAVSVGEACREER